MGNEMEMSVSEASRDAHAAFDMAEESRMRGNIEFATIQYRHSANLFSGIDWHMVELASSWIRHLEKRE